MTMLNIPPSRDLATYRTPPALPLSFAQRWVATVNHRDDDFPAALLGIICPKSPKPALPAAAKVAPKLSANPQAVDNAMYGQPTPCLVPTSTLKRHDAIELITGKISRVGKVVGGVVFLDGGWSISAKNLPTVMLVHRATQEESEGVTKPKPNRPEFFQKAGVDPKPPTLEEAAEKMVGGRPAPKSQVLIMPGDDKNLTKYHLAPFASEQEKQAMRRAIFDAQRRGEITGEEANELFDRNIEGRILMEDYLSNDKKGVTVLCLA